MTAAASASEPSPFYGSTPETRPERDPPHGRPHESVGLQAQVIKGLASLAQAMTDGHDLADYLHQLCVTVAAVLDAPQVRLWQLDAGRTHLELIAEAAPVPEPIPRTLTRRRSLAGAVLARGTLLEALDVCGERAWRARAIAEGATLPHYVGVPLISASGTLGVLAAHRPARAALGMDEREALQLFGQQASIVIEQARLVETLRRQTAESGRLYQIGRQLTRSLELSEVLPQVAAAARATLGAARAVVLLLNADGVTLRQAAADGLALPADQLDRPRGQGLWDQVLSTRQPVVVQDVRRTPGVYRVIVDPVHIRSFIHVPIQLDDTALGILNCSWTDRGAVPADAVERLSALADQAAIAIRNAQLYSDMRAARDRLDAVWRHAGQPLLVLDAGGSVTAANPAAEALFGVDHAAGVAPAIAPAAWPALWARLLRASDGEPVQAELVTAGRDDPQIPVLVTLAPLRGAEAQITAVVAVVTDLRAQKRQEAERVQAERLRALGQLAAGVAHDFNNALAHIVSRAELLRMDYGPGAPALSQGLETLIRGAMDAGATVRRILDFAREQPERPLMPANLDDVIHDVEMLTSPLWRAMSQARAVPIRMELTPGRPPLIMGDPAELREALINLIHNAVAAMPDGGTVTVVTGVEGGRAFISVRDTGVGMDAATRARIFEPFFTTKGAQGSGLGLSMVYGTMRRHGGEVTVQSAPGEGSVFTLWFSPVADSHAVSTAGAPAEPVRPLRILIVDDEPALATMLERMLSLGGHAVTTCTSASRALEQCRDAQFDLVITDVSMPEMNGWELARALHTGQSAPPVAFLTGWGQHLEEAEMTAAGVHWVLAKPFRFEDLQRLVAEVAARRAA